MENAECLLLVNSLEISQPEAAGHFLLSCVGTDVVMRRYLLAVLKIMYKGKINTLKTNVLYEDVSYIVIIRNKQLNFFITAA
jgi:hypothetical protein